MIPKVRNKISLNIPKVPIRMYAKFKLFVAKVPITVQCLVEELLLPLVLELVSNQCMANPDDLLMIILSPKL
jgi:hypothetical protein